MIARKKYTHRANLQVSAAHCTRHHIFNHVDFQVSTQAAYQHWQSLHPGLVISFQLFCFYRFSCISQPSCKVGRRLSRSLCLTDSSVKMSDSCVKMAAINRYDWHWKPGLWICWSLWKCLIYRWMQSSLYSFRGHVLKAGREICRSWKETSKRSSWGFFCFILKEISLPNSAHKQGGIPKRNESWVEMQADGCRTTSTWIISTSSCSIFHGIGGWLVTLRWGGRPCIRSHTITHIYLCHLSQSPCSALTLWILQIFREKRQHGQGNMEFIHMLRFGHTSLPAPTFLHVPSPLWMLLLSIYIMRVWINIHALACTVEGKVEPLKFEKRAVWVKMKAKKTVVTVK